MSRGNPWFPRGPPPFGRRRGSGRGQSRHSALLTRCFFGAVGLPAGKARLRRPFAVALERYPRLAVRATRLFAAAGVLCSLAIFAAVSADARRPRGINALGRPTCDSVASDTGSPFGSVVLGRVAIWPSNRVLQMNYISSYRPFRYWGKQGVEIRSGAKRVELIVPAAWRDRISVTWGDMGGPEGASAVRFANCRTLPDRPWKGYAGGFFARKPVCAPLVVRVGSRQVRLRVALGRSC